MSNVIHHKAVEAVEAKPERWEAGRFCSVTRLGAETYRINDDAAGCSTAYLRDLHAILTAILSPPPAASTPVASEDPRRDFPLCKCGSGRYASECLCASIPRRIDRLRWVPAEKAIQDAVDVVESMGADVRLTYAVCLLAKAREAVADYVDRSKPVASEARATFKVGDRVRVVSLEGDADSDNWSTSYSVGEEFVVEWERVVRGRQRVSRKDGEGTWIYASSVAPVPAPTPAATTEEEDRKRERDERIALELLDKAAFDLGVAVETMRSTLAARKERGA